jgi:hypothetical protein
MVQRRSKPPSRSDEQGQLDFSQPPAARKPSSSVGDVEKAARTAIARRAQPAPFKDKVNLTLTLYLNREQAERLSARAIREEKNLEALMAEILEAASK